MDNRYITVVDRLGERHMKKRRTERTDELRPEYDLRHLIKGGQQVREALPDGRQFCSLRP
jgi:hypothetical protein